MPRLAFRYFYLLAVAALPTGCVFPITTFVPASDIIAADSSADHRALLTASWADQVAFEAFRIQNLPRLWGPYRERPPCREPLGRFCLNPGTAFGAWTYVPEPPSIAEYRLVLIRALRAIARRIPGDDWVAGQLVRYTVEAGLYDEAKQAALDCAGTDWWCAALAGYALHRAGDAAFAELAFGIALAAMPPAERQRWTDPSALLDHALADSLRAMPEADQARFVERFWRLADPFLSRPGNEIHSEHLSRRVEIQFQHAAGFLEGLPWQEDLDEVLVRYGMPGHRLRGMGAWFDFMWVNYYMGPPFGVTDLMTHYTMPGLDLLPPAEGLQPGKGSWDRVNRWPRAGYNLRMGDSLAGWLPPLVHQAAMFRRGDAAVVVVAFDLAAHGIAGDVVAEAGLALVPLEDPLPEPAVVRADRITGRVPLVVVVEPRPALMSLEVAIPDERMVGRARRELEIRPFQAGSIAISDIVLVEGDAVLPDSLVEALRVLRGSNRVRPGETVGLFWEMYGLDPERDPQITMSLRLIAEEPGLLRRLGRFFGLVPDYASSEVSWQEQTVPGPRMARSIGLAIPDLPDGTHTLELTMEVDGLGPFVTQKELLVGPTVLPDLPRGEMTRRPVLRRPLCGEPSDEMIVGNEGNLQVSQQFRESEIFREFWAESWQYPPVVGPRGMRCADWVRTRDEYFGHGPEHW